jgi:hypothetical protein
MLPEKTQIMYFDLYYTWENNNVLLTRDPDKAEVEENFADSLSLLFTEPTDLIHMPSKLVMDTVKNILKQEFGITFH